MRTTPPTDLELIGLLLERIVERASGKPASEGIAAEVTPSLRLTRPLAGERAPTKSPASVTLAAPAPDVGRFFLKHQFNGRPLSSHVKAKASALIGRQGSSIALIERRDDLLLVVLLTATDESPPEIGDLLRKRIESAIESLQAPAPATGKRKAPR